MTYENMRDSGFPWIGKIPDHWHLTKTLHCLSMAITDGPHTTPALYDNGVPFISAEAVSCGNGRIDFSHMRGYISEEFYAECCKKYIPQIDDVYMIKSGATTGRVAIVDTNERFTIWSPLAVFRANPDRVLPKFLFYALQSESYQKQVELGWTYGTQQNIGMRTLETLTICLPPLGEQDAIVSYLDRQCATTDSIIEDAKASIEDYKRWKASMIYQAVTKGLDPNANIRESGIPWIGKIPFEWKCKKISLLFSVMGSGATPPSSETVYYSGKIPWLQSGDIGGREVSITSKTVSNAAIENISALKIYASPFIAVAMYGASIANASVVYIDACTNQACFVFSRPHKDIDLKYGYSSAIEKAGQTGRGMVN